MQLTYIIALLFALIVTVFALLNAQPVTVDFMYNELQISLALVILASAFAGAAILGFLGLFRQVKEGIKFREMNAKVNRLENRSKKINEELAITNAELTAAKADVDMKNIKIEELNDSLKHRDKRIEELMDRLTEEDTMTEGLADRPEKKEG